MASFVPPYAGKLAATDRFDGKAGDYVITLASNHPSAVYTSAGSLVATFNVDGNPTMYGCSVGPGYPASYGPTLWTVKTTNPKRVLQIDLGNGGAGAVAPASLGRVKAIFK